MTPAPFAALYAAPVAAHTDLYALAPMDRVVAILAAGGELRQNPYHVDARDLYDRAGVYRGTVTARMVEDWSKEGD